MKNFISLIALCAATATAFVGLPRDGTVGTSTFVTATAGRSSSSTSTLSLAIATSGANPFENCTCAIPGDPPMCSFGFPMCPTSGKGCICTLEPTCDPVQPFADACADFHRGGNDSICHDTALKSDSTVSSCIATPAKSADHDDWDYRCSCGLRRTSECPAECQNMSCPEGHAPSCNPDPSTGAANCQCRRLRGCNVDRVLPIEYRSCDNACVANNTPGRCDGGHPDIPEGFCVCSA